MSKGIELIAAIVIALLTLGAVGYVMANVLDFSPRRSWVIGTLRAGVNDGSPDAGAVRAFNTLTGKDLMGEPPVFWEDIGSQIRFNYSIGTTPT